MTHGIFHATWKLGVALLSTLFVASAAAQSPQPQPQSQGTQQLDELDEVVVQGRHLAEQIEKAESKFYALFNEVNKDDRYDTHCVYLQMSSGSRIQSRACIPGFVADAMADWAPFRARCQPPDQDDQGPDGAEFGCLDRNNDGRLSLDEASARSELGAVFIDAGGDDGFITAKEFRTAMEERGDLSAPAVYQPPPPQLVLMEGSDKWYQHMLKVTNADPRLQAMAADLGGLYKDLAVAQRRYNSLEDEEQAKKARKVRVAPRIR